MEDLLVMISIIIYYSELIQNKKRSTQGAKPHIEREKTIESNRSNSRKLTALAKPTSPASWQ